VTIQQTHKYRSICFYYLW